jgi:membrane-associated phospholipid phosphatase
MRVAALSAAALAVGVAVTRGAGSVLDARAFRALNAERVPHSDDFFSAITELGSIWASVAAAATLAAIGERRAAVRGLGAASSAWAAGQALKRVFGRDRPYLGDTAETRLLIAPPKGTSWPSSHPAVLLAFTTAAGPELGLGTVPRLGLDALAGVVGLSRVHLGVHYPGDVLGGLLMGRAIGRMWSGARERVGAASAPDAPR